MRQFKAFFDGKSGNSLMIEGDKGYWLNRKTRYINESTCSVELLLSVHGSSELKPEEFILLDELFPQYDFNYKKPEKFEISLESLGFKETKYIPIYYKFIEYPLDLLSTNPCQEIPLETASKKEMQQERKNRLITELNAVGICPKECNCSGFDLLNFGCKCGGI